VWRTELGLVENEQKWPPKPDKGEIIKILKIEGGREKKSKNERRGSIGGEGKSE